MGATTSQMVRMAGSDSSSHHIAHYEWEGIYAALNADGAALLPSLLDAQAARGLTQCYDNRTLFRSKVVMARHNFGSGEYQYFGYPLPPWLASLRSDLYSRLVAIANQWAQHLGKPGFPIHLMEFSQQCRAAGQSRPTSLLLRYDAGDYNCLHQDLYGGIYFPLQVAVLLSSPGEDFEGGEFVLTEQRPRMQSRVRVIPLKQGDAVVFAVNHRPVRGARGYYRTTMRHGVSNVVSGQRFTLGVIMHDAA